MAASTQNTVGIKFPVGAGYCFNPARPTTATILISSFGMGQMGQIRRRQRRQWSDEDAYRHACDYVLTFQERHQIPWVRFAKLANLAPELAGLDRRRWVESVQTSTGAHEQIRRRTFSLQRWIERSPNRVLDALGVPPHRRQTPLLLSPDTDQPSPLGPPEHSSNPYDLVTDAMRYAGMAYHEPAFLLLTKAFARYRNIDPERAMIYFSGILYIGYRYMAPARLVRVIEEMLRDDSLAPVSRKCDPTLLTLGSAQILCALNERLPLRSQHDRLLQERLLRADLQNVLNGNKVVFWSRAQLLRNVSRFYSLRVDQWEDARTLADLATEIQSAESNQRAVATIMCLAHTRRRNFDSAWTVMKPRYEPARKALISLASNIAAESNDLLHLYSGVFYGALARHLAGAGYSDTERQEDIGAMEWCIRQYRAIETEVAPFAPEIAERRLSPELERIRCRCEPALLTDQQADALISMLLTLSRGQ